MRAGLIGIQTLRGRKSGERQGEFFSHTDQTIFIVSETFNLDEGEFAVVEYCTFY